MQHRAHRITGFSIAVLTAVTLMALPDMALAEDPMDILVVVNKSSPIKEISLNALKDYFLKKRYAWKDGSKVVAINDQKKSYIRSDFRKRVLEMTEGQEITYWQRLKVKEGVTPPPEFSKTLKVVFKIKSAISYVYRGEYLKGVAKVVLVIPYKGEKPEENQ